MSKQGAWHSIKPKSPVHFFIRDEALCKPTMKYTGKSYGLKGRHVDEYCTNCCVKLVRMGAVKGAFLWLLFNLETERT